MQNDFKVGLLGAGFICDYHINALKMLPNIEIIAICDQDKDRAKEAARNYNVPQYFTSLEQMLKIDIDVVHVLLPPELHVITARAILESGRHVFLEKPMGLSSADCQSLVDLAKEKQVKLGVDHNFLFLPSYTKLREQAADGTLGNLDQITINWLNPLGLIQSGPFNNWILREPQNIFFEVGPHLVSFMMDLIGPVKHIQVDNFRALDIPGGNRIYCHWHVHGIAGNAGVDLNLSVTPGVKDSSIFVRGQAAKAYCDYARDIYYRNEPSGYGLLFDNFATSMNIARQLSFNGIKNFVKSVSSTLKKNPAANPFGESIQLCIKSFYDTINGQLDSRLDGQFGANVIAVCEQITSQAQFEPAKNKNQSWAVLPPKKKPTVLVLGGTGFIGKNLVQNLVASDMSVRVVTRNLGYGNIALAGMSVELVQGDLSDPDFMDSVLEGIEIVYHLAKANGKKWDDYYRNDVLVTKNIAERAKINGIKRFIYTGTIDSYYSANQGDVITSDTPLDTNKHRNYYARSKAACEALLMDMYNKDNFPIVIFRPGIVIGKGSPPAHWGVGMFQSETRVQLWGDGKNKLPFVLVEDVAKGLALAIDKEGIEGQAFLLTDEPLLSAQNYIEIVSQESGTKLRMETRPIWKFFAADVFKESLKHLIRHPNRRTPSYRDWDSRSHRARYDSSKTRDMLDWEPASTYDALVEYGIKASVRDYFR